MPHNGYETDDEPRRCAVCGEPIDPKNYKQIGIDQFYHPDCLDFMSEQYELTPLTHEWRSRNK